MKITVASKNPVKINSTTQGFQSMMPDKKLITSGISVPSGVSDQPMTDEETLQGAINRVLNAKEASPDSDFWVGIEGGLDKTSEGLIAFAWIVIANINYISKVRSATFLLPKVMSELIINEGKELGEADDIVFGRINSKQESGSVGVLSHNVIDRTSYYKHPVELALIPFVNQELYMD